MVTEDLSKVITDAVERYDKLIDALYTAAIIAFNDNVIEEGVRLCIRAKDYELETGKVGERKTKAMEAEVRARQRFDALQKEIWAAMQNASTESDFITISSYLSHKLVRSRDNKRTYRW
jgi:hypothetical protein